MPNIALGIPPISTENKQASLISISEKTTWYGVRVRVLVWDRQNNMAKFNWLMGYKPSLS
jgi:hypothetical protein